MDQKLFNDALMFALKAHDGVSRKSSSIPFILHPMEVATIVSSIVEDQEIMAAALLHDTVEDAEVSLKEIEEKFGRRVCELVASETEDKLRDMLPEDSWQKRKEDSLLILKNTKDPAIKILWLADKLANMRSFYQLYLKKKDKMWENFHQRDAKKQEWYYRTVGEYCSDLSDTKAYQEYIELIDKVFGGEHGSN